MGLLNRSQKTSHLTPEEREELAKLSKAIDDGLQRFRLVGLALARIRDRQLYRETHESFEAFIDQRWHMTRQRAYQLIEAATIAENVNRGLQTPVEPTSERQMRPLSSLTPDQQTAAWTAAIEQAPKDGTGTPQITTAIVAAEAQKRSPKRKPKASRKPKPIRVRVPLGIVTIERRTADQDPADLLREAIDKLRLSTIKVHDAA
jgi:hypothetical protein